MVRLTPHVQELPGVDVSSQPSKMNGQSLHTIDRSKVQVNKILGRYERDISFAPAKVPLHDIHTNLEQFQIRKTPYSEESVRKIISAVKKGNLFLELFNPIVVRYHEGEHKLYVLAGHSRLEAFHRLSDPTCIDEETGLPLCQHPQVIAFMEKQNVSFERIWAHIVEKRDLNDAKWIAAISNTLGTPESLVDRAVYYQAERDCKHTSDKALEQEYKILEGKNRATVLALSYLNPNGKALQTLESFSGNDDSHKDIIKVCKRIGEARRKHIRLSNLHEDELFDRLITHKGYGFSTSQIARQSVFIQQIDDRIAKLKQKNAFRADRKLNVLNKRKHSYAIKQYESLLSGYRREISKLEKGRKKIEKEVVAFNLSLNGNILDTGVQNKLENYREKVASYTTNILQMRLNVDLAEKLRFEFKGTDQERLRTMHEILSNSNFRKEQFKMTRQKYIEAEKAQTSLFTMDIELGGEEE